MSSGVSGIISGAYSTLYHTIAGEETPSQKSRRVLGVLKDSISGLGSVYLNRNENFDTLEDQDKINFILYGIEEIGLSGSNRAETFNTVTKLLLFSSSNLTDLFVKMDKPQLKKVFDVVFEEKTPAIMEIFQKLPILSRCDLAIDYLSQGNSDAAKNLLIGSASSLKEELKKYPEDKVEQIFLQACVIDDSEIIEALKGNEFLSNRGVGDHKSHFVDGFQLACEHDKPEAAGKLLEEGYGVKEVGKGATLEKSIKTVIREKRTKVLEVLKRSIPEQCLYAACKVGDEPLVVELKAKFSSDRRVLEKADGITSQYKNRLLRAVCRLDLNVIDEELDEISSSTLKKVHTLVSKRSFWAATFALTAGIGSSYALLGLKGLSVVAGAISGKIMKVFSGNAVK